MSFAMRINLYFVCLLLAIINVGRVNSVQNMTLTRAILREHTSPKPTTVFRRINVEKDDESSNSISDISTDTRRKKNLSYIFRWDRWCQIQPRKGNCKEKLNKYFYDSQLDECASFIYSGCDSNKNNFETLLDCEQHCKGANFLKVANTTHPTFCYLQPDVGLCLALLTKYYFDINEKTCKQFIYGGCGGNSNKFDTKFSCMKTCEESVA